MWKTMGAASVGSASGIVITFGIAPRYMISASRWVYGTLGACIGALIGIFYGLKGRPILL